MLTYERANELLRYDSETGRLSWRVARGRVPAGAVVSCLRPDGYIKVRVDNAGYMAHRVAWLLHFGVWPTEEIDHINMDRADNRLENLRAVSKSENQQNQQRAQTKNIVNLLGVSPRNRGARYRARICVNGVSRHIGSFATPEEAHEAYLKAKRQSHPAGML